MSTPSPEPAPTPPVDAPGGVPDDAPVVRARDVADDSRVRRAPRYGRFGFAGFLVGVVLSVALTFLPVAGTDLSRGSLVLLLLLTLGTVGVFAGLLLALLADRRSLRRRGRE